MCFSNVDHEELYAVTILYIEVVETHGPLYEWRSSVATEDQSYWLSASEVGESNGIFTVYVTQFEIRGNVPDFRSMGIEPLLPVPMFFPISNSVKHLIHAFLCFVSTHHGIG